MSNMMSVSSLNTKIKSLLEATFMHTLVEGEVSSATYHTSGHLYFSIKDDKSSVKCVMWRSSVARMKFKIEKGMQIVVDGSVSVYTPRGEYQFQCVRIEPSGQGALALAYEQLKQKLKDKGYFEPTNKKTLPKMPKRIALVTAKDSAALHDMLKIIEKRWKLIEVSIIDTLVQGEQAAKQIVKSLHYADSLDVDVIVVGRGGGSVQDLWAFNEEIVADAIYAMRTPVVSAVGHEVDTLISDFVADLRAPTPSAAMEMILPDSNELRYTLDEYSNRYTQIINGLMYDKKQKIQHQEELLKRLSPAQKLVSFSQNFSDIRQQLSAIMEYKLEQYYTKPIRAQEQLKHAIGTVLQQKTQNVDLIEKSIKLNNPKLQQKEGWAQVVKEGKKMSLNHLHKDDIFTVCDADVKLQAKVLNVEEF